MASTSALRAAFLPIALFAAASVAACEGCRTGAASGPTTSTNEPPTVRLYLASSIAGALEPCGCSKNQLGGFDHFAALFQKEAGVAKASFTVAAGPLFFLDPSPRGDQAKQDEWKADAIAAALGRVGFVGWAPGANDWAAGAPKLASLRDASKGAILGANLGGATTGALPYVLRDAAGTKIAFIGLSTPERMGIGPDGVTIGPADDALKTAIAKAKGEGAKLLIGVAAMKRGEALRAAEGAPDLNVLLVGKPFDQGEANDKPQAPTLIGKTVVVETANHLQTVGVLDFTLRDPNGVPQDASGLARSEERAALMGRIADLESKIRKWSQSPTISPKDLQDRQAELAKLRADLDRLGEAAPPATGSYFRYAMREIKGELGKDPPVADAMLSYYDKVNTTNKAELANRLPPPPDASGNRFIGVAECAKCHAAAKTVWDGTAHAHAYKTLSDQHKEFNLDCVSCHVTGYEKPGGSTVTHADGLTDVQCENCHGPGARHREKPGDKTLIIGKPSPDLCTSACHHPPHVEDFDPVAQMRFILGPGHGKPM